MIKTMISQTKMLIITSNEDLIHEVSTKNCQDTRIINLGENNSTPSIPNDNNNLFDLNILAQLSELNSNNDQMYKRVLNSTENKRSKGAKISKKLLDLICVICGDHAIGFNYDLLTCASCKAFFRRNAQYNPAKLRCLTGKKQCLITHNIHRKCQRCRLEKCFKMGMRKDFILSEEEKQKRRQRMEENRQLSCENQSSTQIISPPATDEFASESMHEIDRLLMETDNDKTDLHDRIQSDDLENVSSKSLSIEDWSDIENVQSSYSSIFENENLLVRTFDMSDRISALISWSEFASQRSLKLINYFKQIDEFEDLNVDDRFTLIKYNLLPLYLLQRCVNYDFLTGSRQNETDEERLKRREFYTLCYGESGIRESFKSLMHSLSTVTQQDSTLINLLLLVLLFSKGLSMDENEPLLKDIFAVNRAQSHYIRLTWNYLVYKQGEEKTEKQFIQLLSEISRIQSITTLFRDYFRSQFRSPDSLERFSPLMHAVLNIA